MAACRRFFNLPKKTKLYLYKYHKAYSTSVEVKTESPKTEEVIIPYRIYRRPTDILKALASTISKDYTAPKYKYEDDPYFIPASNVAKRAFALSKESGKKAARYFLEKYPELFKCNISIPHIKAFDPPTVYLEENVSSADALIECIMQFDVNNSIIVYDILKEKGIPVNQAIKHDLLELLSFYNGSQPPDEDYYEDRYFQRIDEREREKWDAKGMAEQLFQDMEKDAKAYSAMIAGSAKFQDLNRALHLHDEMRDKGLTPTIEAYNALISLVPWMQEMVESRWECIMHYLSNMDKDGIKPDLFTMNSALEVFLKCRRWKKCRSIVRAFLAEMKRLNVEPSLGTYSLILSIFCSENADDISVLYEIMNMVEGKEFTVKHPSDVTFFTNAIYMCMKFAPDKDLVYRIHNLLELKNNCKLLGNSFAESYYFKHFFKLLCEIEELDKIMEMYERYVPNTYTPEPLVMFGILQTVHFTGLYKYLPKLCSDILLFEHTERENVLSLAMEAAGIMKHDKQTQEELVHIVWKIIEKLNIRLESKRYSFNFTGEILGNVLNTFINGEDLEKSWSILNQLSTQEQSIVGFPEKDTLKRLCGLFLQNQDYEKVKFCIKYAVNGAYPDFGDDFKMLTDDLFEKQILEAKYRVPVDAILNTISFTDESFESSNSSSSSLSSDNGDLSLSSDDGDSSSSSDEDDK